MSTCNKPRPCPVLLLQKDPGSMKEDRLGEAVELKAETAEEEATMKTEMISERQVAKRRRIFILIRGG